MNGPRRDLLDLLRRFEALGGLVVLRKGGHYCLTCRDGRKVFTGSTPGDRRAVLNLRRDLRHLGYDL